MGFIRFDSQYSYEILDETTRRNQKQLYQLTQRANCCIEDCKLYIGASLIALMDAQHTNRDSKFAYFGRHPTSANQKGKTSQEALIHTFQLQVTGTPTKWLTLYSQILYDPQQSFGSGTITSLERNQLQLRRGYLLLGDLTKCPVYLSIGKMATPFGLTDTVSPFSASTVGHIFGGLSFGTLLGFQMNGFHLQAMLAQGGPQFRATNSGHSTPSKLDNYVLGAYYEFVFHRKVCGRIGASYVDGSAFCKDFPISHFASCHGFNNPAWNVNLMLNVANFTLISEFASTTKNWPGTFNPHPPLNIYPAHKVQAFGVGLKYNNDCILSCAETSLSADFSQLTAGPSGSPWERQSQLVLGFQLQFTPYVKAFAEYVHTRGYSPLNFISGIDANPTSTESDRDARSDIFIIGMQVAI